MSDWAIDCEDMGQFFVRTPEGTREYFREDFKPTLKRILADLQAERARADALQARVERLEGALRRTAGMGHNEEFCEFNPEWAETGEGDNLCTCCESCRNMISEARAALALTEAPRNQCDGCAAGVPVDANGMHRMGGHGSYPDFLLCQASKYAPTAKEGT